MELDEVLARIRAKADELGGDDALAVAAGVSRQFVSAVLRGTKKPSAKLLDVINVELVKEYREKGTKPP